MRTYPKINTIWKRNENGKIIPGDLSDDEVGCVMFWNVSEKIDGMNIRVGLTVEDGRTYDLENSHNVYCLDGKLFTRTIAGRTDNANIPKFLMDVLDEMFPVRLLVSAFQFLEPGQEVVLFGEGYGPKIQHGGKYSETNGFILFDVWFFTGREPCGLWTNRDGVLSISKTLGVPMVREMTIPMSISEIFEIVRSANTASDLARDNGRMTRPEGYVMRPPRVLLKQNGDPLMWKIKVRDFEGKI